jgi:excisionase family DNA binding protein
MPDEPEETWLERSLKPIPKKKFTMTFHGARSGSTPAPVEAPVPEKKKDRGSDAWLKVSEVAKYLGMSEKAVRNNAAKGNIPASKMPKNSNRGTWMFKKDDIDSYLKKAPKKRKPANLSIHDE